MNSLDEWRLCDHLSITDAAALLAGYSPSDIDYYTLLRRVSAQWPKGLYVVYTALCNAVEAGTLSVVEEIYDQNEQLSSYNTLINVNDLENWCSGKGFYSDFFYPRSLPPSVEDHIRIEGSSALPPKVKGYLDEDHPCYSIKLKAAIDAWEFTANSEKASGLTPKQRVEKWLRKNASKYELLNSDGEPNKTGIEEIAKVVHWRQKGGVISQVKSTDKNKSEEKTTKKSVQAGENLPEPLPF